MSANALESQGTILYLGTGTGSPETFEEIQEVISITGPSGTANVIDVSDLRRPIPTAQPPPPTIQSSP